MVTGKRISALKEALIRLTDIITTFDTPGISVRWLNTPNNKEIMNNIKTVAGLNAVLNEVKYRGVTPLGEALDKKIIRPFVKAKTVRNKKFEKPVLVSIITDGEPDDAKDLIENIREMKWFLSRNGFKDSSLCR